MMNMGQIHERDKKKEATTDYPGMIDYSEYLRELNIEHRVEDEYCIAGDIQDELGWIIDITAVISQLDALLEVAIPVILKFNVPFKVVRDKNTALNMLSGALGISRVGKVVCVFLNKTELAVEIASGLISITKNFKGPQVFGSRRIDGVVYARYGYFYESDSKSSTSCIGKWAELDGATKMSSISNVGEMSWPFSKIEATRNKPTSNLINGKYRVLEILKNDAKGNVLKAMYVSNIIRVRKCVIKEGKLNMWSDFYNRDISDRLQWQRDLHIKLSNKIKIPKVIDFFQDEDSTYLVIEFIDGCSLEDKIIILHRFETWKNIRSQNRAILIKYLLSVIDEIIELHNHGMVHCDINPVNFIVTKRGELYLIDVELAYSSVDNFPNPPFSGGTPGYMSPNRINGRRPSCEDDIFGLGALMVLVFTGLPIDKYDISDFDELLDKFHFFIGDIEISKLVSSCLSEDSSARPSINSIKSIVEEAQCRVVRETVSNCLPISIQLNSVINRKEFIEKAIIGLTSSDMLSSEGIWMSNFVIGDKEVSNPSMARTYYPGFQNGLSGIMYLLAIAKKFSFSIDSCIGAYTESWKYIHKTYMPNLDTLHPGLNNGAAGIAISIKSGIDSGLISPSVENLNIIQDCFSVVADDISIGSGVSGQGIALINCLSDLNSSKLEAVLMKYKDVIVNDGRLRTIANWKYTRHERKIQLDLIHGNIGAVYFILKFLEHFEISSVKDLALKSLESVIAVGRDFFRSLRAVKGDDTLGPYYFGLMSELACITAVLIRGYKLFRKVEYKELVENILLTIPQFSVPLNYSQARGLAGIGEIYIEALKVFGGKVWEQRIEHIVMVLFHTKIRSEEGGYFWQVDRVNNVVPDFMSGNSGLIHFLLRDYIGSQLNHVII